GFQRGDAVTWQGRKFSVRRIKRGRIFLRFYKPEVSRAKSPPFPLRRSALVTVVALHFLPAWKQ
ncbi:MAG: hypothetical protein LIQ31_00800, partial [Planctomycetes bacterium]|nr:hypothetical protein [Planctomycetota bacterium]